MAEINQQDILKAFYRFDCAGIVLTRIGDRAVPAGEQKKTKLRIELAKSWLDLFKGLDRSLWEKAVEIALSESKIYPDDQAMIDYVVRAEKGDAAPTEPAPKPAPSKKLGTAERMAEMFRRAKAGDFAGAYAMSCRDYTDEEIVCYAKEHWPDCDGTWIDKNYYELKQLLLQEKTCNKCMSLRGCTWHGMRNKGRIDKYSGCLEMVAEECPMRRPKKNEVQ